ncbi:uncharacterized protein LOC131240709 isoform X2 [Magnolia sinica]|uniref:uncharacterized protein LOC131240709 isoform X2 n=1 Tax=Magnolia sinica TaxID=86752 RepID=UPI002658D6AA|nr:uncharacterized protein LOC131240709 isoform X2 [Magnolia sinica]
MAVDQPSCKPGVLKGVVGLLAICLAVYIVGPPLYWHFTEGLAAVGRASSSCPPCVCDCSSQPLLSMPEDCGKRDAEVNDDMERNFTDLLSEELKLREAESLENQRRADMQLLEAKKMASQYQKEADKCNSGMETCEEAREKAESALQAQKRLSEMWEMRARQRGWKEGTARISMLRRELQEV